MRPNGRLLAALALALLAVVAVGLAAGAGQPDYVLVVEDADGDRLVEQPVREGSTVTLAYTHSVEKTPVDETYVVEGTTLRQRAIVFSSYGWGFPANADVNRTDDGRYVWNPNRTMAELYVSPGSIAGHTLRVGGETYDLYDESDGETVRIYVVERTSPIGWST